MASLTITKDNFEAEVAQSQLPVLIDFWADWCGPCKMFSPIVEQFAEENEGKVKVGKINADEEQELTARFGIRGIPTAILFKNGEEAVRLVGLQPKEKLEELLK